MQVAEFARKGCLPFAGGMLDQPATLMDAVEFVWDMERPAPEARLAGPLVRGRAFQKPVHAREIYSQPSRNRCFLFRRG
jgi:hypothetical protein